MEYVLSDGGGDRDCHRLCSSERMVVTTLHVEDRMAQRISLRYMSACSGIEAASVAKICLEQERARDG